MIVSAYCAEYVIELFQNKMIHGEGAEENGEDDE
jgi:hypothetical protein